MLITREYGAGGPTVIAIHGGPGAAGSAAPIARGLADTFHVLEPWQRGTDASSGRLTVDQHIADLHALILSRCGGAQPALVGESWGAMLALSFTAAYPKIAGPLVLVGCGTWDKNARAELINVLEKRINDDPSLRSAIDRLAKQYCDDPMQQMARRYELTHHLYDFSPLPEEPDREIPPFDANAHNETWQDMLRLQEEGLYPSAFSAIRSPVLMLHGDYDPHPGVSTRDTLRKHVPQLEYVELARCGHSPWRERFARDEFFAVMRQWIHSRCDTHGEPREVQR
jgi:pimeloyl-ACP methyl ester carboxylesterase